MAMASYLRLHGKLIISYNNNNSVLPITPPSSSSSYRPMTITATTTTSTQSSSNNYWAVIEGHLKKSITIRPPLCVFEPMHHLTFAAPKSRAPALCMAACELVGGSPEDAVTAASAIHLMHAAAYTHQHLPLTDRPTVPVPYDDHPHHLYDPNIELLLPDGMVPYGFEILGRSSQHNPDQILRVIIEISGSQGGIVDHEMMMLCSDEEYICEKKEIGELRLHGCAAACGAILGGGSEEEIQKLRKFGVYVGIIQGILVNGGVGVGVGVGKNKLKKLKDKAVQQLGGGLFTNKLPDHISSLLD